MNEHRALIDLGALCYIKGIYGEDREDYNMYDYSPISKIYIKNFRNIGDVTLDFNESPIICLVGDNEAGKTSVVKAFSVCALHSTPRDQKDFIRDNTQMFGVAIDLKDGHRIIRKKSPDVNKYQVIRPDGTSWETTKIAEGLPVEVSKLMGLIEEPETKEYLHIRTYEDKLLFVVTQSSTNYKVMYDALKVGQLTRAIKNGSNKANELKSSVNRASISIETLNQSLRQLRVVDTEPLDDIKLRLSSLIARVGKIRKALAIQRNIEECNKKLGILRLMNTFNLREIDLSIALRYDRINKLLERRASVVSKLNGIKPLLALEDIDTSVLNKASSVLYKKEELCERKRMAGSFLELVGMEEIGESRVSSLTRAIALLNSLETRKALLNIFNANLTNCIDIRAESVDSIGKMERIKALRDSVSTSKAAMSQCKQYVNSVLLYLKQCGVAFETCPNCGNDVLIDLDKMDMSAVAGTGA